MRTTSLPARRPRAGWLALLLWLAAASLPAVSGGMQKPPRFFIGFAAGYFHSGQADFRDIYHRPLWPLELQFDWALGRKLSLLAAARYLEGSGDTVWLVERQPEEKQALRWRMATARLGFNWRLGSSRFVPFVGAGASASFYRESWLGAPLTTDGRKAGFFVQAGGRYRLQRCWHALVQLDYASIPAGSGPLGRVNLGGLSLFLGLLAGIF